MTNSYFLKDLLDLNTKGGESNRYVLAKKVKTCEEITFTCLDVTSNDCLCSTKFATNWEYYILFRRQHSATYGQ